jgi:hypothetical protein
VPKQIRSLHPIESLKPRSGNRHHHLRALIAKSANGRKRRLAMPRYCRFTPQSPHSSRGLACPLVPRTDIDGKVDRVRSNHGIIPRACVRPRSASGCTLPKCSNDVFWHALRDGTRPTTRRVPAFRRELVLKLGHSLQLILGGVIHHVIGIPMLTGAGCGGCRGGSCGTGGGLRGGVSSRSSCRRIRRRGRC